MADPIVKHLVLKDIQRLIAVGLFNELGITTRHRFDLHIEVDAVNLDNLRATARLTPLENGAAQGEA